MYRRPSLGSQLTAESDCHCCLCCGALATAAEAAAAATAAAADATSASCFWEDTREGSARYSASRLPPLGCCINDVADNNEAGDAAATPAGDDDMAAAAWGRRRGVPLGDLA